MAYRAEANVFGQINCGHTPYLYARPILNLRVVGRTGQAGFDWVERDWEAFCAEVGRADG
jgi:hypothetical protein